MKAQRRQELKTNELVETLRQAREFLEKYGTYVAGGVIVAAVILVAGLWYRNSLMAKHRHQWEDYYTLEQASTQFLVERMQDPQAVGGEGFEALVARHKTLVSSASEPLVRLRGLEALGDFCWQYALRGSGSGPGPESGASALEESAAAYEQIVGGFPEDAWAGGNALMALAVIAEERGDFDQAREIYGRIEADPAYVETTLADLAKEALEQVDELREPIVFAPPEPAAEEASAPAPTTAPAFTLRRIPPPMAAPPIPVSSEAASDASSETDLPEDAEAEEPSASEQVESPGGAGAEEAEPPAADEQASAGQ